MTNEDAAYVYLEIDRETVEAQPRVSQHFKYVGGEDRVWEILESSDSPEARKLCAIRSKLTKSQRDQVPFEAFAVAAGLSTKKAFGAVSEALVEYSQDISKLLLHTAAPILMEKAIAHASEADGVSERKTLLMTVGIVPRPKNSTTVINGDVVKGNKNSVSVLPDPGEIGRKLSSRFMTEMAIPVTLLPAPEADGEDEEEFESSGD